MAEKDWELYGWQKVVEDYLDSWEDLAGEQSIVTTNDFERNQKLSLHIKMPINSGHTFLTAYLSSQRPVAIVFRDIVHWKEIETSGAYFDFEVPNNCQAVSVFEIYHGIGENMGRSPSRVLQDLKNKIQGTSAIIVDRADGVDSVAIEWLMNVATGPLVFLG